MCGFASLCVECALILANLLRTIAIPVHKHTHTHTNKYKHTIRHAPPPNVWDALVHRLTEPPSTAHNSLRGHSHHARKAAGSSVLKQSSSSKAGLLEAMDGQQLVLLTQGLAGLKSK